MPDDAVDQAELDALRAEVARLRRPGRWKRAGRWTGAVVLLVLAALLAGIAVIATFTRDELLDTDTYVATVAPLAQDPSIQAAVTTRVTDELLAFIDVDQLAADTNSALQRIGAPKALDKLVGILANGVESFIGTEVGKIVSSDAFATAWADANRVAHQQMDAVLTGEDSKLVQTSGTAVSVDLGAFLEVVKQRLVARGMTFLNAVPQVHIEFTVFDSPDLAKAQRLTRLLNTLATWLPWIALALLVAGVLTAPNRRRGILVAGICLLVIAGILVLAVPLGRSIYRDNLPPTVNADAAMVLYDQIAGVLDSALKALFCGAVIWTIAAWLAGSSRPARAIRGVAGRGLAWLGTRLGRLWPGLGRVARFVGPWRAALWVAAFGVAVVVLIAANRPGPPAVLWTAAGVGVFLLLVELLVKVPRPEAGDAEAPPMGG